MFGSEQFNILAGLTVGNVLPLGSMPEGTIVCNVEGKQGDRGAFARASGNYATIIAHNPEEGKSRVRLPSGKFTMSISFLILPKELKRPSQLLLELWLELLQEEAESISLS